MRIPWLCISQSRSPCFAPPPCQCEARGNRVGANLGFHPSVKDLVDEALRRYRLTTTSSLELQFQFSRAACARVSRGRDRSFVDSPLEGDGFELPVPRVLEPSQFTRLLDTAFAFCRRDRRRI